MKKIKSISLYVAAVAAMCFAVACKQDKQAAAAEEMVRVKPAVVTGKVAHDSDDPAIWIHPEDPSRSLIIGTDKGGDSGEGGLYVFDLQGNKVDSVKNLRRPNNVDVAYGLVLGGGPVDIAVCTERQANAIRVFSLPSMQDVDGGGLPVFEGESLRDPMGISLYTDPATGKIYAIVGRKSGPLEGYLWQYLLEDNGSGTVQATLVRKFGRYSGEKEIEAIAVDNELGYVYCSDEGVGVRKYYAHPDSSSVELALFATEDFSKDHEGISIYKLDERTGYILVSDQQANRFHVFTREGAPGDPHRHRLLTIVNTSTEESDGSDATSVALGGAFPQGLFVAMSDDGTFQLYRWEDMAGSVLKSVRSDKQ